MARERRKALYISTTFKRSSIESIGSVDSAQAGRAGKAMPTRKVRLYVGKKTVRQSSSRQRAGAMGNLPWYHLAE